MKLLAAAALAAVALYAPQSDACTNPEKGAETPTVTGQPSTPGGGSTTPGGSTDTPTASGTPTGSTTPGTSGGINETGGGTSPTATPDTGAVAMDTQFVEVSWSAAREVDGDPNNSGYWSHSGHRIATRVEVKDVSTGQVVLQETVPQYDYPTAVKGTTNPTRLRFATRLDEGRYEVRVQTVFTRHNEVRYGMAGSWQPASTAPRAIDASVPAAKIIIPAANDTAGNAVSGGCSASGAGLLSASLLLLLNALGRRRRALD